MKQAATPVTFRALLTAILFGLLIFSVGLIGAVSLYFGTQTVHELADTIVRQALRQAEGRVQDLVRAAVEQNEIAVRLTDADHVSARDFERLFNQLAPAFAVRGDLSYLGLGIEATGEYCMLERLPGGGVRIREYVRNAAGQMEIRDHRPGRDGRELTGTLAWDGYDPRTRPFYQQAKAAGRSIWTDSYAFWAGNERGQVPGLTYATPVFAADGRLAGVWDSDFDTYALCGFLRSLKHDAPGHAVVVEETAAGERRIIAHPSPELLIEPGTGLLRRNLAGFSDLPAHELLARHAGPFATLGAFNGQRQELRVAGRDYLAGTQILRGDNPPRWLIAMLLPTEEVMGQVRENRRWAGTIFFIGLGVALLAAIRISERTSKPLKSLEADAAAIGRLELAPTAPTVSRIREIDQLSTAVDEMKTNLRSFRKYVPADVVGELIRSGREAVLGGQNLEVTIYFSDIQDFTTAAEKMTPAAVVAHLGEYLGLMSEGIAGQRGTLDKFIGDAVMAFWNAPQPAADHAARACRAAWLNQKALARRRPEWLAAGCPPFHTRIALHTGGVVVGNIGSEGRLNYTIIGDPVNLTSRLEKVNKRYGTAIILSEVTFLRARPEIVARPLDVVAVRGRTGGITCHELLGPVEEATDGARAFAEATTKAFASYRAGRFAEAAFDYREVLRLAPGDVTAGLLLERCERLRRHPPAGPWTGLWEEEAQE